MFDLIDAKFGIAGQEVIFAWGDTIYNPLGVAICPALMAHEAVHGRRQGNNVERWWLRYLDDAGFRLAEELAAHKAEFWHACRGVSHERRDALLRHTAKRLCSPLYGGLLKPNEAERLLRA